MGSTISCPDMNANSTDELNAKAAELQDCLDETMNGGEHAPFYFLEFLKQLFSLTVAKDGQSFLMIETYFDKEKKQDCYIICGPKRKILDTSAEVGRESYQPMRLNDGRYAYIYYQCFLNKDNNNYLTVANSKFAYQLDEKGIDTVLRIEYQREAANHYPASHFHIHGRWIHEELEEAKELVKFHFPAVRSSIESFVLLLINEFEVKTNSDLTKVKPLLRRFENVFLDIARKKRLDAAASEIPPVPNK